MGEVREAAGMTGREITGNVSGWILVAQGTRRPPETDF
jgi:hypothetical protein